jgi:hypothetical protein
MNRLALPRRMDGHTLGDSCRVIRESSIGSGWKHLANVLAELEARQGSLPPRRPSGSVLRPEGHAKGGAA